MQIKLLVTCRDEHRAHALCARLAQACDGAVSADAMNIDGVLRRAAATKPDVLLLEHKTGEEERSWLLLSQLGRLSASTRILLLCDAYTQLAVIGCIQRGASGCLLASSDPSLYAKAVVAVHQGEVWFGRKELLQALRDQIAAEPLVTSLLVDLDLLTAREREILDLVGSALSNKEIARRLKISDKTVKTHLHHIYVKLHRSGRYKAFLSDAIPSPKPG
jgi:DNA-binding NarL/FixJ family response regulator